MQQRGIDPGFLGDFLGARPGGAQPNEDGMGGIEDALLCQAVARPARFVLRGRFRANLFR